MPYIFRQCCCALDQLHCSINMTSCSLGKSKNLYNSLYCNILLYCGGPDWNPQSLRYACAGLRVKPEQNVLFDLWFKTGSTLTFRERVECREAREFLNGLETYSGSKSEWVCTFLPWIIASAALGPSLLTA